MGFKTFSLGCRTFLSGFLLLASMSACGPKPPQGPEQPEKSEPPSTTVTLPSQPVPPSPTVKPEPTKAFAEPRSYRYSYFASEAECEAQQPTDFHVNCDAVLQLCPDGGSMLMVTDIANPGTYELIDGVLHTTWPGGDVPSVVTFALGDNDALSDNVWKGTWRRSEAAEPFRSCAR